MSLFSKLLRVSPYAYLAAIVIVAAFLRLYRLDFQSLWYDELHSVVATHPDQSFAALVEYCKTDQPPAFFLLLQGWFKLFAYTEWWGRLLAALIGVAGIVAAFWLGREMSVPGPACWLRSSRPPIISTSISPRKSGSTGCCSC